jgi:hypothetical protein
MRILHVFLAGVFLGFLQFSIFFTLESNLSSAGLTYLTTTSAWLLGLVGGLCIRRRLLLFNENMFLAAGTLAFYALSTCVHLNPYDNSYLILYLFLTAVSGLYGGVFFNSSAERFQKVKDLFFWENNGFIFGLISSFIGFAALGSFFLHLSPAMLCCALIAVRTKIKSRETTPAPVESPKIL